MSPATGKSVPPMLATLGHPPTGERWAWEGKWDGMRAIATTGKKTPALWSRNGNNGAGPSRSARDAAHVPE